MSQVLQLSFWTYFERDPKSGRWIAWVLELDAMTVGEELAEAIEMAHEAAAMTLAHDLEHGLDPGRRSAPEDIWQKWRKLMAEHKARPLDTVMRGEKDLTRVATQVHIQVRMDERTASEAETSNPLAWPDQMCA